MAFYNINKHKSRLPVTISKNGSVPSSAGGGSNRSTSASSVGGASGVSGSGYGISDDEEQRTINENGNEIAARFNPMPPSKSNSDLQLRISSTTLNNVEDCDVLEQQNTGRSNKSTDRSTKSTDRSTKSTGRSNKSTSSKSTSNTKLGQGPLAKAMQKKPQAVQKSCETYADEKVESVSQKMRGKSKTEQIKRREEMEVQLKEAEAQIVVMKGLIEQREKYLQEQKEEAEYKSSVLEETIANQEEKLIEHGIDPVTGEKIVISEEAKQKAEPKFTKKRIQQLREKLRLMNEKTEHYLTDIENTCNYLDSLEDASSRAGPISAETQKIVDDTGTDDFIAKVYAENVPPRDEGEDDDGSDGEEDGDGQDRKSPYGRNSSEDDDDSAQVMETEKGSGKADNSKLFLTREESREGTIDRGKNDHPTGKEMTEAVANDNGIEGN